MYVRVNLPLFGLMCETNRGDGRLIWWVSGKFDECIASAGVANMPDQIHECVALPDRPAAPPLLMDYAVIEDGPICGGHSSAKPADDEIRGIIGPLK